MRVLRIVKKWFKQLFCNHTPYPFESLSGDNGIKVCSKCSVNYKPKS